MKKIVLIAISFLGLSVNSNAQVANFDALTFDSTGVWNGSDLSGFYEEEGFRFYNSFNYNIKLILYYKINGKTKK